MARGVPAGFRPYIELQKQLPKGTPRAERARLARELKVELARNGLSSMPRATASRSHASHESHVSHPRRNPDNKGLLVVGGIAAGLLWLRSRAASKAAAQRTVQPVQSASPYELGDANNASRTVGN